MALYCLHLNLECRKQEIKGLINNAREQLGIDDEGPSITVTNAVDLIFGPPGQRFASKSYKLLQSKEVDFRGKMSKQSSKCIALKHGK